MGRRIMPEGPPLDYSGNQRPDELEGPVWLWTPANEWIIDYLLGCEDEFVDWYLSQLEQRDWQYAEGLKNALRNHSGLSARWVTVDGARLLAVGDSQQVRRLDTAVAQ